MFSWRYLFSGTVLQRGRDYYYENLVGEILSDNGEFSAKVYGSEIYETSVCIRNGKVTEFSCTCPYAEDGKRCKHMAALLFKIENEKIIEKTYNKPLRKFIISDAAALKARLNEHLPKEKQKELAGKRIYPFTSSDNIEKGYHYFNIEDITAGIVIYEKTYEKAKKLIEMKSSEDINCFFGYPSVSTGSGGKLFGHVGFRSGGYAAQESSFIEFNNEKINLMACRDQSCAKGKLLFRGKDYNTVPCEHELALLIYLEKYLKENNPGDATDMYAGKMMKDFKSRLLDKNTDGPADIREIKLEPRLLESDGVLKASFKIGQEKKMYVLKDLPGLVNAVDNKEGFPLGAKLDLNFAGDCFDKTGKEYFALVSRYVKDSRQRKESFADCPENRQEVPLFGSLLDEFFKIGFGCSFEYLHPEGEKTTLKISSSYPKIKLFLEPEYDRKDVFHGVCLHGELPELISGASGEYLLTDSSLSKLSEEEADNIRPLINNSTGNSISMHIGRRNLTEFYYDILPIIRKSVEVEEENPFETEKYLPPEAEFTLYLDVENGTPVCRGESCYGGNKYPLTDWFKKNEILFSRDEIKEVAVVKAIYEYFPNINPSEEIFVAESDPDSIYRLVTEGVDRLSTIGRVMSTSAFDSITVHRKLQIKLGVSVDSDLMNLTVTSEDVSLEELYDILKSYKLKKKYHRLKNGEFINLDESFSELGMMVDSLRLSPKEFIRGNMNIPAYRALYLDKMLESCSTVYVNRDVHFRNLIKDFKTIADSDYEVPADLEKIMRPYQEYGYKWLRTLAGNGLSGILADDMGLGKTLQMIAVLLAARDEGEIGTSIVVCPASLVYNWVDEFSRFAPDMKVCPIVGNQQERQEIIKKYARWDVLITSYDLIKRDSPSYEGICFLYEVLDEAQYIKTHSTSAAKSVKIIRSRHRFALTGTPIENRLSELWSIFDFLMPGFLYGYETFRKEIELPITKKHDSEASVRLKSMVAPFILRRLKNDVLKDIPPKTEEMRIVRFDKEQQLLYDAQVAHMKNLIGDRDEAGLSKNKIQILAELTKIRQICCDPSLLFENYTGTSAKREAAKELIHSAIDGGHKILLFSQFTSMLDLLKKDLDNEKISYYEITGETPKQLRFMLVNSFNSDDVQLFLISLKAGGTGLNLTGADIVIHYDPWWNAAAQNQATDRAHRIGQTKPVTVFKIIVKDSIEEKICRMQELKLSLADEIIGGTGVSLGSLSREELLSLIT